MKTKSLFAFLISSFFIGSASLLNAQTTSWKWVVNPSTIANEAGLDIAADNNGNTYTVGTTNATYVSNPLGTVYPMIIGTDTLWQELNGINAFIVKYDKDGNPIWGRSASANSSNITYSYVTIDNENNIYTVGTFSADSVIVGNNLLLNPSKRNVLFIVKYNSNGDVLNTIQYYSQYALDPTGIITDDNGELYLTGTIKSASVDFDNITLSGPGSSVWYNPFLVKIDKTGKAVWGTTINGGSERDGSTSIVVDNNGGVYIGGFIRSTTQVTFDTITIPASANKTAFIAKYNTDNGSVSWVKEIKGKGNNYNNKDACSIEHLTFDNSGNLCALGHFIADTLEIEGTVIEHKKTLNNQGIGSAFLVKYDNNGDFSWLRKPFEGMTFIDQSNNAFDGHDGKIVFDSEGNLFLSAPIADTVKINETYINSDYSKNYVDAIIAKFNENFELEWANIIDGRYRNITKGLDIDGNGGVYTVVTSQIAGGSGGANDKIFFGDDFTISPIGNFDFQIAKLNGNGGGNGDGNGNDDNNTYVSSINSGDINLYPNPSTGLIKVSSENHELKEVSIYNIKGELIHTISAGSDSISIDLSQKADGIYFIKIQTENEILVRKIIIRK